MNSRTTILVIVLAASIIGCLALINGRQDSQYSNSGSERGAGNPAIQAPSTGDSAHDPSRSHETEEESDLMEELLSFLPEDTNDRTIVYAGGELMAVEGLYIDEDSASGSIAVIGLTKITLLDGSSIITGGDDATMTFDPTSGTAEIVAESMTLVESEISN